MTAVLVAELLVAQAAVYALAYAILLGPPWRDSVVPARHGQTCLLGRNGVAPRNDAAEALCRGAHPLGAQS